MKGWRVVARLVREQLSAREVEVVSDGAAAQHPFLEEAHVPACKKGSEGIRRDQKRIRRHQKRIRRDQKGSEGIRCVLVCVLVVTLTAGVESSGKFCLALVLHVSLALRSRWH